MEAAKKNSHRSWTEFSPPGGETKKEVIVINLCISSETNYTDITGSCLFHRISLQNLLFSIVHFITAFEV